MSKKIDFRIVIVLIICLFVAEHTLFNSDDPVDDVTFTTKEKTGEVQKKVDSIIRDTIYIPVIAKGKAQPIMKELIVDSLYKAKYDDAVKTNDTLTARNLFLESIALDTYEGTLINNKDIKIDGKFLTRGKLLEYDIKYKIKSDTITYTPEIRYRHPKLSLVYGLDAELPTVENFINSRPSIGAHVGLQFKSGSIFKVGINSNKNITLGYSRTLRIFK